MSRRVWVALGTSLALSAGAAPSQEPSLPPPIPAIPVSGQPGPLPDEPDVDQLRRRIEAQRQSDVRDVREVVDRSRARVHALRQQLQQAEAELAKAEALFNGLNPSPNVLEPNLNIPELHPMAPPPATPTSLRRTVPSRSPMDIELPSGPADAPSLPPPATPFDPPPQPQPARTVEVPLASPFDVIPEPSANPVEPPTAPIEAKKRDIDRQIERLKAERARLDRGLPAIP